MLPSSAEGSHQSTLAPLRQIEMALLIVRPSGDLVFVSTEMPKVDLVELNW